MGLSINLKQNDGIYVIPIGAKTKEDVVHITIDKSIGGRLLCYHNDNFRTVSLEEVERAGGIEEYIQQKLSWRSDWE